MTRALTECTPPWPTKAANYPYTVNQQILVAINFGVSPNTVIWRPLNLASLRPAARLCSVRSTYMLRRQILAKTRNSPNIG